MNKLPLITAIITLLALSVVCIPVRGAVTLNVPTEHIPGQTITVTVEGMTVGSDYYVTDDNDAGATTWIYTAVATTMYFTRSYEKDSDLSFIIKIFAYNGTTPGAGETGVDEVYLVQTEASEYLNTDLFIAFLAPLVLIGVIVLVVGGILVTKKK